MPCKCQGEVVTLKILKGDVNKIKAKEIEKEPTIFPPPLTLDHEVLAARMK